ncbi:MAG TPA: PIG-L family deacetylase [Bacteroidales bacterium]|mgnify:FL=1|nr:PIG-L family deacetylase [Bacteroidales bacterium]HOX73806.1 PIG-L family deacetylase [Bacteroidales bacterium]HPM86687.1 PIG-L family deacetylase [Bacteroidales bacterium]HQM68368.1 PIG-L family deacetylase [Bacteroidales bacterium]
MNKTLLAIFAHPDDAEIVCTGTLLLMRKAGWNIHIATMTPGDKGTTEYTKEDIGNIRQREAAEAAKILDGSYSCLGLEDVYLMYDRDSLNRTISLIRKVKPSVVITASPNDYMVDHEMTSRIVKTACFAAGIKNMECMESPLNYIPYLYYSDPMELKDIFGVRVNPDFFVDISGVMKLKEQMLGCHKSQRDWLLAHHKVDEYILSMKNYAEIRGREANTMYAEGFRQHLGHSFPQDNIIHSQLPDLFIKNESLDLLKIR